MGIFRKKEKMTRKDKKKMKKDEKKMKKDEKRMKKSKSPSNSFQFVWMLIIGIIKSIPRLIKKKFIKMVILFFLVLLINTYLLVVKNEGFAPSPGNRWLNLTALKGRTIWASANWALISFFIMNLFYRIKEDGFKKTILALLSFPKLIIVKTKSSKRDGLPTFLITAGFVLIISTFINNKMFLLLSAFMIFLSLTKNDESLLLYFFQLLKNDIKNIFRIKKNINESSTYLMVFSIIVGLVISYYLKNIFYVRIFALILIVLAILYKTKKLSAKTISSFFIFLSINFVFTKFFGISFADDGGWSESGATVGGWVKSPGAGTAISMGIKPAAGSLVGVLVSTALNELSQVIDMIPSMDDLENLGEDIVEAGEELYDDLSETVDEIIEDTTDFVDDGIDELDNIYDELSETFEDGYDELLNSDVVKELGLDLEAVKDMFENMVDNDKTIVDMIKDLVKPEKPEDVEIVDNSKWYSDTLNKIMELKPVGDKVNDIIKNLASESRTFGEFMKDMVKGSKNFDYVKNILEGNPKAKLGWLRKTFDEVKGFKDARVGMLQGFFKGGLATIGGIFDMFDNVAAGDSLAVGTSKAVSTAAVMVAIGETETLGPQLAAFELGNHLLFADTKVADIASPTKMIKGSINAIADYGGLDQKEFNKRVNSGYYGENIKNMIHSKRMADDFIKDPKGFYNEVCDFTDADKDGWKNMNNTVDEIFKLPKEPMKNTKNLYTTNVIKTIKDHPLDSVRRLASDAGNTVFTGVVKVGEGWAYIGRGAGELSVSVENSARNASRWIGSWFKS